MKVFLKRTAALLSAVMLAASMTSCGKKKDTKKKADSGKIYTDENIGKNEIKGELEKEATGNDTGFTLNSVIRLDPGEDVDGDYYYLDITIKNETDTAYKLNTLNNFYLCLNDKNKTEIGYFTGADLYGNSKFDQDIYSVVSEEYELAPNGEFNGIVGGFKLTDKQLGDKVTVCFFPTKDDANDKEDVIKIEVPADKIIDPTPDMLK